MTGNRWKGEVKMYNRKKEIVDVLLSAYANKDDAGNITNSDNITFFIDNNEVPPPLYSPYDVIDLIFQSDI